MTDAELSKQEWLAERAGILQHMAGFPADEGEGMAEMLWDRFIAKLGDLC